MERVIGTKTEESIAKGKTPVSNRAAGDSPDLVDGKCGAPVFFPSNAALLTDEELGIGRIEKLLVLLSEFFCCHLEVQGQTKSFCGNGFPVL
jgi:hypothetical protein